ncbi:MULTISPECIES: GntR family transcriptional regulator [Pseudomonas]|uniref:Putative GntR-family transcriptional regulator n=1 Tax=Pseudomonas fluorescens (strain Pf0-1) TaxID=205922 RepID=Q3KK33_PSEPF|nr:MULTISPECIES: GntR family transcriptional regulator [Pseudomonas]MBL0795983.1 GntR family transcriptional regulator [Pseudomonas sp. B7]ABA71873.1 putative GntR-family transcriptional regulator [Pseudomonas fluorescens Pf0-1]MBX8624108.1 GntR family transcriptional regulator [Pseudomonas glycinae]MBY9027732.1 GntR family transcriptional regulator [Pseudomonas fluorescens]MBY9033710.1 GntR family transcriptional regulator [Pseudomonas fluorescens]
MTQKPKPLHSIKVDGPIPAHLARSVIEETLRAAILDGRLPCGTAVRQQDLADLFGVSRMPVREALRQLEAQGLLNVIAHKGAVVAPLIQGDATETYELRILLESEALRQSIPLLSPADHERAAGYIEELEIEHDYTEIGRLNRLFHMALYSKAPNGRLLRLVEDGLNEEERFLRFNLEAMGLGKLSQDDHRALLQAVKERDTPHAVTLLEQHLNRGVEVITRYLASSAGQSRKAAR